MKLRTAITSDRYQNSSGWKTEQIATGFIERASDWQKGSEKNFPSLKRVHQKRQKHLHQFEMFERFAKHFDRIVPQPFVQQRRIDLAEIKLRLQIAICQISQIRCLTN